MAVWHAAEGSESVALLTDRFWCTAGKGNQRGPLRTDRFSAAGGPTRRPPAAPCWNQWDHSSPNLV
jgi:hypothetical protein